MIYTEETESTFKARVRRLLSHLLRDSKVLSPLRIDHCVEAEKASGQSIENMQILLPARAQVSFGAGANDRKFLKICKYFNEGSYARPNIFVCEVPGAYCHIGTGLVCTRDQRVISDSQMEYRLGWSRIFRWFKPLRVRRLRGTYATINNVEGHVWWHWLVDCLPRLYSLHKAYPGRQIVLLMPKRAEAFSDSLASALPPNFEVQYLPAKSWVKVDRMLLPSYVSGRCNGHLSGEYYEFMRQTVFSKLGLPLAHAPQERIYISRARASHRRILNEVQLMELLDRYGFKTVALENMSFREQVKLFHRAEMIVSAEGSSLGNILFSGKIKILVLYPNPMPNTHNFTVAKALGQEHYFVVGREKSAHVDFTVDLAAIENVLTHEMGVRLPKSDWRASMRPQESLHPEEIRR